MDKIKLKQIIEICLLSANKHISIADLKVALDYDISDDEVAEIINQIESEYQDKGIFLVESSSGFRFRTAPEYSPYLSRLYQIKPPKRSKSFLEVLAIIAYRQPITRGEIEEIRGVTLNNNVMQTLLEQGWIESIGQKMVPGKPEIFATTAKFLDDLGLKSLEDLPKFLEEETSSKIETINEILPEGTDDTNLPEIAIANSLDDSDSINPEVSYA